LRVLIVEDEVIISMLLARQLAALGCEIVRRVSTGEAALDAYADLQPDLVLMDIRLAGPMDGIEAAKTLLAGSGVKIAFMTAYGDAAIQREIDSLPHIAYFHKPVSYGLLERLIDDASALAPAGSLKT
jgi:CheY-like chemotaxis protein